MTTTTDTTYYAAIDATNPTGTVYGLGATPDAALAEALSAGGDPCVAHDDRGPDHGPADHYAIVPCSARAYEYVQRVGGAPHADLQVSRRVGVMGDALPYGVWLRSEEEE